VDFEVLDLEPRFGASRGATCSACQIAGARPSFRRVMTRPRTQLAELADLHAFADPPRTGFRSHGPYTRSWETFAEKALGLARSVEESGWLAGRQDLQPGALERAVRATAPLMRLAQVADGELTLGAFAFALSDQRCVELVEAAPAVAVAFLDVALRGHEVLDLPFEDILARLRERAGHPRREILQGLGYPVEALRVLQKVPATSVALVQIRALRDRQVTPRAWALLRHLPRVTATAIELATNGALARHVGPGLLQEAAAGADALAEARLLLSLRRLLVTDAAVSRTVAHIPLITGPLLHLIGRPALLQACSRPLLHRIGEWEPAVAWAFTGLLEDTLEMARVLREAGHPLESVRSGGRGCTTMSTSSACTRHSSTKWSGWRRRSRRRRCHLLRSRGTSSSFPCGPRPISCARAASSAAASAPTPTASGGAGPTSTAFCTPRGPHSASSR